MARVHAGNSESLMQRRGFLGLLGGMAAGMVLDTERLLWRRGAKMISVPAPINLDDGAVIEWTLSADGPKISIIHKAINDLRSNPQLAMKLYDYGRQQIFCSRDRIGNPIYMLESYIIPDNPRHPSLTIGDVSSFQRLRFDGGRLVRA